MDNMLQQPIEPTHEQASEAQLAAIRDDALVELAKTGDHSAFGELVRRHRARACHWAQRLTHDPYAAEDIVQDALVRAFLHMGDLMDNQRFMPWLRRIVSNQAYMKLRRGGPYGKELPFTSYAPAMDRSRDMHRPLTGETWASIDSVLDQLCHSIADAHKPGCDPVSVVLRKETMAGIRELLHCLTKRERAIFESYFFGQLSPAEIAALFQTSTSNVYNHISTAKRKVQQERIKVQVSMYLKTRRASGLPLAKVLPRPPY